jgi:hypothetical protein
VGEIKQLLLDFYKTIMLRIKTLPKAKALIVSMMFFFSCQNSYFEGTISYNMEYIDETGGMNKENAKKYMGDKQVYFFKRNKYKSVMNGVLNTTLFYTGKDTLYNKIKGIKELMYINTMAQEEKIISFEIKKNQTTILGYNCDVLDVITTDGTMKYYFNNSIKINSDLFKRHEVGFWRFCLDKTEGALPIKWEVNTSGLKLTTIASEIEQKKLKDSIFQLPKDLPLVKG